jgi:hypothetical protein
VIGHLAERIQPLLVVAVIVAVVAFGLRDRLRLLGQPMRLHWLLFRLLQLLLQLLEHLVLIRR